MTREQYRKRNIVCFKSLKDNRYSDTKIVSHNGSSLDCMIIEKASQIEDKLKTIDKDIPVSIGIEEAQFLDQAIAPLASTLASEGYRVFVAGLDLDSFGHPFGPMPELLAYADRIIKLHAQCVRCGEDARMSYRKANVTKEREHVGGAESYEARCISCWRD